MLIPRKVVFDVVAGRFYTLYAYTKYALTTSTHVTSLNLTQDAARENLLYAPRN